MKALTFTFTLRQWKLFENEEATFQETKEGIYGGVSFTHRV